jgi:aryl-phospho-beta-D-glucosidase BglC (GH1 family)
MADAHPPSGQPPFPLARTLKTIAAVVALLGAAVIVAPPVIPRAEAATPPSGWSAASPLPASFSPRWDFATAYFPPADQVVLFGGSPRLPAGDPWKNDTWLYTSSKWTLGPAAPGGLSARGGAAIAYFPPTNKLVLFGGGGPVWPPKNDTWLWNGVKWSRGPAAPPGLGGRVGARMVYDEAIGKLVLFGGSGELPYRDTWLFNGTTWTKGPSAPAAMSGRTFFGMTYDPTLGKVYLAGGNGATDGWYFDGSKWTAGPALAPGAREHVTMDYIPQLGGSVMFGGIGPGVGHDDLWLFRGGVWTQILKWTGMPWPDGVRLDGAVLWHPVKQAIMLVSGIIASDAGIEGYRDTWLFQDIAPTVESVTLAPNPPTPNQAITLTKGPVQDGYRNWYYEYAWYKNDVLLPSNTDTKLTPDEGQYKAGDRIQAQVRVHDHLNVYGPWVSSNVVTVSGGPPAPRGSGPVAPAGIGVGPPAPAPDGRPVAGPPSYGFVPEEGAAQAHHATPGAANGQPTAHDGKFWLGSQEILLRGMNVQNVEPDQEAMAMLASWGMNVLRYHFHWAELEPTPPTFQNGTWVHTWNLDYLDHVKEFIATAQAEGLYTIIDNHGCGGCGQYFSFPDWLYTKPYNSHGINYEQSDEGITQSQTDFWSDPMRQSFQNQMWSFLAKQLKSVPGIAAYEVLNEPKTGDLEQDHTTTAMTVAYQLSLSRTVRAIDPARILLFGTRSGFGPGSLVADWSEVAALGNVAFDLHNYFGARWGNGYGGEKEEEPDYQELIQLLYNHVLSDDPIPPYFGTAWGHVEFAGGVQEVVGEYGMPLFVGEIGDKDTDMGVENYWGSTMGAMTYLGASFTIGAYGSDLSIVEANGELEPYADIVIDALAGG